MQYLCAAVFYHNSGIRLSLWKTFWNVLWYPLVWNVPQKCKSCHWLSKSTWPSKRVLLHCWAGGRGGQQGKAKEKLDFSFHLEDSYWQNGIQCTPGTGESESKCHRAAQLVDLETVLLPLLLGHSTGSSLSPGGQVVLPVGNDSLKYRSVSLSWVTGTVLQF